MSGVGSGQEVVEERSEDKGGARESLEARIERERELRGGLEEEQEGGKN